MKYLKMLGLAVVATVALIAFLGAGSASATVLCLTTPVTDTEGDEACAETEWDVNAESTIEAALASGQSSELTSSWGSVTCPKSTLSGTTSNTGGATETVTVALSTLSFEECKCAGGSRTAHVTVVEKGSLQLHHISKTHNATLTGKGQKVTATCTGLGSCIFGTGEGVDLGTATGGSPASVSVEATVNWISGDSGSFICGLTAAWKANYSITNPNTVYSAELAYAGATLRRKFFQNGKEVSECKFTKENEEAENCLVNFTVQGKGGTWKVEGSEWQGAEPEVRYKKKTIGCPLNKTLKDHEDCTDEIEMIKKVVGTENRWCVLWGLEGGALKKQPYCVKLTM